MDITESRKKINQIDEQMVRLFVERMDAAADIAAYKLANGMNIKDLKREREILETLSSKTDSIYAPYVTALYSQIFEMSRRYQSHLHIVDSIEYGLVGDDVSHSYSKWIHHGIGNKSFGLYSLPAEMLPLLFKKRSFKGLSICAPYKKEVPSYCDKLDDSAEKIGYVNTVVKNEDGLLVGYNTEYSGFISAAAKADISFDGLRVMILGDGAIASSIRQAVSDKGASEIFTVSRTGKINFRNYTDYSDIDILINATSIGSEPDSDVCPADVSAFSDLKGIIDCVYTPVNTMLILEAKSRNIPYIDGLSIMIHRSAIASELFGFPASDNLRSELYDELLSFID